MVAILKIETLEIPFLAVHKELMRAINENLRSKEVLIKAIMMTSKDLAILKSGKMVK